MYSFAFNVNLSPRERFFATSTFLWCVFDEYEVWMVNSWAKCTSKYKAISIIKKLLVRLCVTDKNCHAQSMDACIIHTYVLNLFLKHAETSGRKIFLTVQLCFVTGCSIQCVWILFCPKMCKLQIIDDFDLKYTYIWQR